MCVCVFFGLQRADQKVSRIVKLILSAYYVIVFTSGVCAYIDKIEWLDFFYYCSYIKLSVTLIKYIPQVGVSGKVLFPRKVIEKEHYKVGVEEIMEKRCAGKCVARVSS